MSLDPKTLADLRRVLVTLYPDASSAHRVASDAGLDVADIDFSGGGLNRWAAILEAAIRQGVGVEALLTVARGEYPRNPGIIEITARITVRVGDAPRGEVVTILFMSASPRDMNALGQDNELREIKDRIQRARHRDRFVVKAEGAVRVRDLQRVLRDSDPTIVHFSGHGEFVQADGAQASKELGAVVLLNDDGNAQLVPGELLVALLERFRDTVRVAVLNACFSDAMASRVAAAVGCCVGMSVEIEDAVARTFSESFYEALAGGESVEGAFQAGCLQVRMEHGDEDVGLRFRCRDGLDAKTLDWQRLIARRD